MVDGSCVLECQDLAPTVLVMPSHLLAVFPLNPSKAHCRSANEFEAQVIDCTLADDPSVHRLPLAPQPFAL